MSIKPASLRLFEALRDFRSEQAGNVAIMFGLLAVLGVGGVGAAVDYSRANWVRTSMQTAADSVALMISKEASSVPASKLESTYKITLWHCFQNRASKTSTSTSRIQTPPVQIWW